MIPRWLPLAGLAVVLFIGVMVLTVCNQPPSEAQQTSDAVRAFNAKACARQPQDGIPGGTQSDGSCEE